VVTVNTTENMLNYLGAILVQALCICLLKHRF